MANHQSAKKRIRQTARKSAVNIARRSRLRTYVRKVEEAIASGEKDAAEAAYKAAMPVLHRGAQLGILHRNTAARKLSRLAKRIGAL